MVADQPSPEESIQRPFARLGVELRRARESRHMSLRSLARELNTTHSNLHDYELGFRLAPEQFVEDYEQKLTAEPGSLLRLREEVARAHAGPSGTPGALAPGSRRPGVDDAPSRSSRRHVLLLVLVIAIGAGILLWANLGPRPTPPPAPASGWQAPQEKDHRYHCGTYGTLGGVSGIAKFQECVVVSHSPDGAWYQGLLAVSYTSGAGKADSFTASHYAGPSNTRAVVRECGEVTLSDGMEKWCFTKTVLILRHQQPLSAHASLVGTLGSESAASPVVPS